MNRWSDTLPMRPRKRARLVWLGVALLLWQVMLPWLAAQAAQQRAQFTAEVCSVFGVRTVSIDTAPSGDDANTAHGTAHGASPCALAGVWGAAIAWPPVPSTPAAAPVWALSAVLDGHEALPPDPARRWSAGRKQGPPRTIG